MPADKKYEVYPAIYGSSYAVWKIKEANFDLESLTQIYNYTTKPTNPHAIFKTSVSLTTKENTILPVGTSYWWDHAVDNEKGAWIYDYNNMFYKMYLKIV